MPDKNGMLELGLVGKTHGLKGEIFLNWFADQPLSENQTVYLEIDKKMSSFKVVSLRMHKGRYLVAFEGISDCNQAEKLKGKSVFVQESNLPALSQDEAYLQDLIGYQVFLSTDVYIGILDHVEFPANQQIWSILDSDGREILFPAQPVFIDLIDADNRKIIITPPEGLLEIYSA